MCGDDVNISNQKAQRLLHVAQMYYEQEMTQNQIASVLKVSRPLVSRMLQEAKACGIVKIEIRSLLEGNNLLLNQLRNFFNIKGGMIINDSLSENATNENIAMHVVDYLCGILPGMRAIGLGWGSIIGEMIHTLESGAVTQPMPDLSVVPLIGNSSVSNRNYHSNENVRIFAEKTNSEPMYLYAPALAESEQELSIITALESYKMIQEVWRKLDIAVVNIGNYPSSPDFGSAVRYGKLLNEKKAVGRLLSYYYNMDGEILRSDTDYAVQIPLEILASSRSILGVCASNISPKALLGALRTGIITHLIAPEGIVQRVLEIK